MMKKVEEQLIEEEEGAKSSAFYCYYINHQSYLIHSQVWVAVWWQYKKTKTWTFSFQDLKLQPQDCVFGHYPITILFGGRTIQWLLYIHVCKSILMSLSPPATSKHGPSQIKHPNKSSRYQIVVAVGQQFTLLQDDMSSDININLGFMSKTPNLSQSIMDLAAAQSQRCVLAWVDE